MREEYPRVHVVDAWQALVTGKTDPVTAEMAERMGLGGIEEPDLTRIWQVPGSARCLIVYSIHDGLVMELYSMDERVKISSESRCAEIACWRCAPAPGMPLEWERV